MVSVQAQVGREMVCSFGEGRQCVQILMRSSEGKMGKR